MNFRQKLNRNKIIAAKIKPR